MQDLAASEMMEDGSRLGRAAEESEVDVPIREPKAQPQASSHRSTWSNGQRVLSVPSCSALNPSFDLPLCRAELEKDGFQIPFGDLEAPLNAALDVPSVRRYVVFNSSLFHFILAPLLYVVVWCASFSTLHLYLTGTDYWVLCLSVSLVSIFFTTAVVFVLHHSNKEISMNLDVRLIQVNERLAKHNLLVAVADWVQNCSGNMQLFFVYWDMSPCLRTLTETLEEDMQVSESKLKKKMSHLVLVAEATAPPDPEACGPEVEPGSDEQRPLLGNEETSSGSPADRREDAKVTTGYSLVPDASLSAQAKAHQLLVTYSAAYVRLLVSERLPILHRLRLRRNHCSTATLCLCQFIRMKLLR